MSSDPLARSDIWTGAPNEAEYDTVYAAVTATERGRWFLTEYASRNRHADTNALVGALARVEAAVRGEETAPSSARTAEAEQAPDLGAAAERIQDIAFMLRERAVDPALCDALDAAAREICDAGGRRNGVTLPAVGRSTNGSQSAAENNSATGTESNGDPLSLSGLFTMDSREREKFAEAIAALAQPVNFPGDAAETAATPQSEATGGIIEPDDAPAAEPPPGTRSDVRPRWYIEPPDFAFHAADHDDGKLNGAPASENGQGHSLLPQAGLLPGPRDDPADLFESPVAVAPAPTVPRPPPPDPLAAMRGLSEDEVIALFG